MSSPERPGRAGRWLFVAAASLALAALALWLAQGDAGVTWREAPPETRGIWATEDARYAGRAIEIGPTSVDLRLGVDGAVAGRLDVARELFERGERILRLEYRTAEGEDALDMVLASDGSMYLKNQPEVVWRLGGSSVSLPVPAASPSTRTRERSLNWFMALGLVGLVALLLAVVYGALRSAEDPGAAPVSVRGVWTTPDPDFAGQSIRIAGSYLFSQFGPGDVRVGGAITAAKRWRESGQQIVALTYRDARDASRTLEMVIDRAGHMRLKTAKSIWVKR